jgi:hypothetical protein
MKGFSWFSFPGDAKAAATVLKHDRESLGIAQRMRLAKALGGLGIVARGVGGKCARLAAFNNFLTGFKILT